jgi:hypothetical protein
MVNSGSVNEGRRSLAQTMVDTGTDCGKKMNQYPGYCSKLKHVTSRLQKRRSENKYLLVISNFRSVLNVAFSLLGDSLPYYFIF